MEEDSETLQSAGSLVGNKRAARNNALVFLGCKTNCASLLAALHQIISLPAQRACDDYEPLLARTWPDTKVIISYSLAGRELIVTGQRRFTERSS